MGTWSGGEEKEEVGKEGESGRGGGRGRKGEG